MPNPKWLLPNCNPIKVRLVYLSSSGLFITVQMAATFGRLSSSLPAARHAKLSSTESGPAPVRGREPRPPGHAGSSVPLPLSAHPPHRPPDSAELVADDAGCSSPLHGVSSRAAHACRGAPNYLEKAGAPGREERAASSPRGEWRGQQRAVGQRSAPRAQCQAAQKKGAPWGARGDAGGRKIKPGQIKGRACRKASRGAASRRARGGGSPRHHKLPNIAGG